MFHIVIPVPVSSYPLFPIHTRFHFFRIPARSVPNVSSVLPSFSATAFLVLVHISQPPFGFLYRQNASLTPRSRKFLQMLTIGYFNSRNSERFMEPEFYFPYSSEPMYLNFSKLFNFTWNRKQHFKCSFFHFRQKGTLRKLYNLQL